MLTENTKTVSLTEAVGMLAMRTYENMMNLKDAATGEKEKDWKRKYSSSLRL